MTKVNLIKRATTYDKNAGSYKMVLEVLSAENISKNIFVKQRLRNFVENNFDDVFVAVCTPAQVEDFDQNAPSADTSYFRVSKIELVSRNADYLEQVFESVLREVQKLIDDAEALRDIKPEAIYNLVSNTSIEIDTSIVHTHYRLPLTAEPSGLNEVFVDGGNSYHRVASQDSSKAGWLNCVNGTDPVGCKFKYNIAQDASLDALWPPADDKLDYAHVEINGVVSEDILITKAGIFWKDNNLGCAPWPEDYVSHANPSPSGETVKLVLDFLV